MTIRKGSSIIAGCLGNSYSAGDWIDITNSEISAKGSTSIGLVQPNLYCWHDDTHEATVYTTSETPISPIILYDQNYNELTNIIVNGNSYPIYTVNTFTNQYLRIAYDNGNMILFFDAGRKSSDDIVGGTSDEVLPTQKAVKTYVDTNDNDLSSRINTKADDNAVVHLTGNEDISGVKTFSDKTFFGPLEIKGIGNNPKPYIDFHTSDYSADYTSRIIEHNANNLSIETTHLHLPLSVSMKDTGIAKGTAPSNDHLNAIYWADVNEVGFGYVYSYYKTNKENSVRMQVSKMNSASDTDYAGIGVVYPASGDPYGFCPHSDTNGSILTTYNKSKAANGYFQLGNGLIVNWGSIAFSGSSDTGSATFSKSFTSSPKVMITRNAGDTTANDGGDYYTRKITTTGFEIYRTSTNTGGCQWIAIGY